MDLKDKDRLCPDPHSTENYYLELFNCSNDGIFVHDLKGHILDVNPKACELFGYSRAQLLKMKVSDLHGNEEIQPSAKAFKAIRKEGKIVFKIYFTKKNGDRFPAEVSSTLYGQEGRERIIGIVRDITERVDTVALLEEQHERLVKAQQISGIGFIDRDLKNNTVFLSDELFRIYGLEPVKGLAEPDLVKNIVHPDDMEMVTENLEKAIEGTKVYDIEHRVVRPNGDIIWVHAQAELERDKDNRPSRLLGTVLNITDRKELLLRMSANEKYLVDVLNNQPECVKILDVRGNLVDMNLKGLEIIEAESLEQVIGYSMVKLVAKEHQKAFLGMLKNVSEGATETLIFKIIGLKGAERWLETHSVPQRDAEGKITGLLGVTRDITEKRAHEQELLYLSQAMTQSPNSIIITDLDGNIEYVNPGFEKSTGYTLDEVKGKNPRLLKSGDTDEEQYRELWDTITAGKTWEGVFHNKRKDGSLFWERTSIAPVKDRSGKSVGYLAAKEDITRLKQTESELQNTLRDLESTVEARTAELNRTTKELKEINKNFMSSLEYAQRIQDASIPSEKELRNGVKDAFAIYLPRDVISGDFYWYENMQNTQLIVLGDCTGHGVPGALMSMAAHELLDTIILDRRIFRTDVILEEMDKAMVQLLQRKDARFSINDGMDMSVIRVDRRNSTVNYSGAKSHGLLVNKGEITALRPARQSIGGWNAGKKSTFERQRLQFDPGSRFFLYTDGVYDQFGGTEGRKMMRSVFEKAVVVTCSLSLKKQQAALKTMFDEWKGDGSQVDDVTILGFEL